MKNSIKKIKEKAYYEEKPPSCQDDDCISNLVVELRHIKALEKELREKFDDDDFFGPIFGSKLTDFKDLKLRFYKLQGWIIDLKKEILGEAEQ